MIQKFTLLICFIFMNYFSLAQQNKTYPTETYRWSEQQAQFPGGMDAFHQFVMENMQFPTELSQTDISGNVYVSFMLDTTGVILPETIQIARGLHPLLDAEAIRLIQLCPAWIPSKITSENISVKSRVVCPIKFPKK